MKTDDLLNNYFRQEYTAIGAMVQTDVSWWNYGKEIWCNMEG